jgi:cytidylate kinase
MELETNMGQVITIDGPAASGKTSVSREIAKRMGWNWVSTGAFYRGLGYAALKTNINLQDESALSQLALSKKWQVKMTDEMTKVFFENNDVTDELLKEEVGSIASKISHFPKVREALLEPQRFCKATTEVLVAEGRDCGTVVFPDAEIKIYLTAKQENRAERRAKELGADSGQIVEAQKQRDAQDASRKIAPMQIPEAALVVDTTELTFEQVIEKIEKHIRSQLKR